jgi:hypothetical protein
MKRFKVIAQHVTSSHRITKTVEARSRDDAELMAIRELADTEFYVLQAIAV